MSSFNTTTAIQEVKSIITKKPTVVLYQGGLADEGYGFIGTVNKVVNKNTNKHVAYSDANKSSDDTMIDMSNFDVQTNCFYGLDNNGYYGKSAILMSEFRNQIANIVTLLKDTNKTVHVRTRLSFVLGTKDPFDTIDNQKKKLIFIIDALKAYQMEIEVVLIGHSQGGLVNLATAVERSSSISRMISISTPYSPVGIAKELMNIAFLGSLIGKNIYTMLQEDKQTAARYKASVENLASNTFFKAVKDKWNKLTNRPSLTVIAGVSGHLRTTVSYFDGTSSTMKQSFDGLVNIEEQLSINFAEKISLSDKNLPCYAANDYSKPVCYMQDGFYMSCKKNCTLSSFSMTDTLLNVGMKALWDWLNGKNIDFMKYPVVVSIFDGVSRKNLEYSQYRNYYNIYASDYSHQFIRYCDETIALISSKLQ